MRAPLFLAVWLGLLVMLLGCTAAEPIARPSKAEVEAIERSIMLPREAEPLSNYARYYASLNDDAHRIIRGIYVLGDDTRIIITTAEKLPVVLDGGCSVVTVEYEVSSASFLDVSCSGEA